MSMQRYLVTARKYRPQRFSELVAQEHVTETLQNAIRLDRLAHAYLFSGPRGVGKTTAARILAKAINCTTPLEDRPKAEPCRQCDSCRSFEEGRSLNIIEIDAASNNKVEDIRELRDTVRIPPQGNRKKVYIVDEVHMLSNAAFNALLKTLEEPPPYVLFIFATTEPNKVLPTILSRCQRFDFRRIAVPEIIARLEEVCQTEGITADEASLMLIARKGDGALRDALSAFDQAVSLCGADLRYAELAQAMGVVDIDLFFEATQHVAERSSAGMLRLVERIVRAGYDLQEFLGGLAEHLRNLLVACTMPDTDLIEATRPTQQRYAEESKRFTEADLLRLLIVIAEAEESIKSSMQPRLRLETALLKMAGMGHAADLRQALRKIEQLETLLREGEVPAVPETPEGPRDAGEAKAAARPRVQEPVPHQPLQPPFEQPAPVTRRTSPIHPMRPHAASSPPAATHEVEEATDAAQEPDEPGRPAPSRLQPVPPEERAASKPEVPSGQADESPRAKPPAGYPGLFGAPALSKKKIAPSVENSGEPGGAPQAMFAGSGALAAVPTAAPASDSTLQRIFAVWPHFVRTVKAERIHVGSLLQQSIPTGHQDASLLIAVPDAFHQRLLENQAAFLLEQLGKMVDEPPDQLQFTVQEKAGTEAKAHPASEVDPYEYMQRKRQESPVIRAIFEHFGGEMMW